MLWYTLITILKLSELANVSIDELKVRLCWFDNFNCNVYFQYNIFEDNSIYHVKTNKGGTILSCFRSLSRSHVGTLCDWCTGLSGSEWHVESLRVPFSGRYYSVYQYLLPVKSYNDTVLVAHHSCADDTQIILPVLPGDCSSTHSLCQYLE